ncbi:MAG: hypothetical protein K1X94_36925 [Sandaracinaceae bacterium]|nr:hypothetical protein [Sandaracinaceae bacterium]
MTRAKKTEEEVEPTADPADAGLGREDLEDDLDDDVAEEEDDEDALDDIPATAEGKASAGRLIELLVEKKALALHVAKPSPSLIDAVARALEWPGPVNKRASKLSDAIVDSDDVDELFVDDDTLGEILKRW